MNNKGFMRIVEATVAVLIVLGALLVIVSQQKAGGGAGQGESLPFILDEIAHNSSLRSEIVSGSPDAVEKIGDFLEQRIDHGLNYSVRICEIDNLCPLENAPSSAGKDVFAAERIISSYAGGFNPRKVKAFLWRE